MKAAVAGLVALVVATVAPAWYWLLTSVDGNTVVTAATVAATVSGGLAVRYAVERRPGPLAAALAVTAVAPTAFFYLPNLACLLVAAAVLLRTSMARAH